MSTFRNSFIYFAMLLVGLPFVSIAQNKPSAHESVRVCWTYEMPAGGGAFGASSDMIFAAGTDGSTIAISNTGQKVWSSELGGMGVSNVIESAGGVYVVTNSTSVEAEAASRSTLWRLRKETGLLSWKVELAASHRHFISAIDPNQLVVVSNSGVVTAINSLDGSTIWRREVAAGVSAKPSFTSNALIVPATGFQVFVIDPIGGRIVAVRTLQHDLTAVSVNTAGTIAIGDVRGNIQLFDASLSKRLWGYKVGGSVTRLDWSEDDLIAASADNFIYSLKGQNGSVRWKRRLAGRITSAAMPNSELIAASAVDDGDSVLISIADGKIVGRVKEPVERDAGGEAFGNGSWFIVPFGTSIVSVSLSTCPVIEMGDGST
jgi:outer membrane protein assembly factor BamB